MKELGIDIETYSGADLTSCGVYRYVEDPGFAVLLFGYSIDGGEVECVDLASGERLPPEVKDALTDPRVTKTAFNAAFERICLGRWLGIERRLDPAQWKCTMVRAARMGLPLSLGQCAEVLGLEEGKMKEGKALIRYFSTPARGGGRHMPEDAPEKWETFKRYNIRDVEVEQAILRKVRRLEAAAFDDELYIADQEINDRGVMIDRRLVDNAAAFDEAYKTELTERAKALTGLGNPNSPAQLKAWIKAVTGITVESLGKSGLGELETRLEMWPKVREMLALRRELGKTSNRKYEAMRQCVCADGRLHGLLQFCGAARTGRWAGRLVQVQNLPQNHLESLDNARRLVLQGDLDEFEVEYGGVTQTLSELIRTAFVAAPGHTFHVCDFSAIEARVIAWLAGEQWVLEAFRQGHDIYCETASRMFGVPVEKHGRNAHLRQRGKVAVLGLGYGGGPAALEAMGGSRLGLTADEMDDIVRKWRESNPAIVSLWRTAERAAAAAISTGNAVVMHRGTVVGRQWGMMTITLPSGRTICYPRATLGEETDRWGRSHTTIEYEGLNQTTRKWGKVRTYGGKIVENMVQAIARDILGEVLLRARRKGLDVVFHIHDEIIVEARAGQTLAEVEELFSRPIPWAPGLPLKGAGYTTPYYLKD